ncbi:melibiose permease/lactose/raffinose/galactose permease [Agromyces cerinus]|uniref:glycoside-pentoside-hexuronide (GPH):cation symporter n=1 Tax=Agromyces cerinus TaxID=33878 RepID=UPI0019574B91|nr:glycoside-pentoside-hexuronide (GPH):cation symporter [Agromyces cerinus]MBM7829834.1 melibiose permease/lactose/raffinose/galactose permease [Agromyces cerinus]
MTAVMSPTRAQTLRNRYGYGIGTIGRDAAYTLLSMFLLYYLSDTLQVSTPVFAAITVILLVVRVIDAIVDPFVGVLVDNTRSRFGKFKPWIVGGVLGSSSLLVALFAPWQLGDAAFIAVFTVVYIAWSAAYAANDIGYWSMLPALTQNQREREKIGAFARICASIGTFAIVIGIVPISSAIAEATGDVASSFFWVALVVAVITVVLQLVMVVLVREDPTVVTQSHTRFRELFGVIFRNDQLLAIAAAFVLFMTAFSVTAGLGVFYMEYVYGDLGMYSVFAAVLGVSQLTALALYPLAASRMSRRRLFTIALFIVVAGYVFFFLTPPGGLVMLVGAGVAVFAAQAVIQIQLLMFIADTVEYGEHKFGRRNDSITLSVQPFIYKLSSALANGVIGWVVLASGMKDAASAAEMTEPGVFLVRTAMCIVPGILIVISYFVYRRFYVLDEGKYAVIVEELQARKTEAATAAQSTSPADEAEGRPVGA